MLRTPFRIAFLPLRLVGAGIDAAAAHFGARYLDAKPKRPPMRGLALTPNIAFGAANDIGIGPALTWVGFPAGDFRLRVAGSWSPIDRRRASLRETIGDRRPVGFRLRADYDYKPNRRYYGIGNGTPKSDLSYFLLATTRVEGALLLGASPLRQLRILGGYSSLSPRRGYFGQPLLEDVFTPAGAPHEHRTTQDLAYGVAGDLAWLDDARDPSRGLHGRFDLRRAAGVRARDLDYDAWRVEARGYVPVFATRRVIAVRGVYAGIDPRGGDATTVPFYLLAQSEGDTRFAGYASERFRDRQLALFRVEYRWAILGRISALGLYELGEVAPRASSFRVADAHKSYGGGLRYALRDAATARFELASSVEGLHAALILGSDF